MNQISTVAPRRVAALFMALAMTATMASAQTKIKSGFNLFSPEQDVEIGQQSAAQAEQQLPLVGDAQVNDYVNRIGQRLAANAGGPGFQYRFRVVNQTDINAFALPGGFVYVNRGVLENARNEGEVAGVIAHEIAHVALRHGTHQASKAYAAQAGLSILGGILGGGGGNAGNIINAVGGLGLNVVFLKFSRELETQADVRGAQILAATGYSPNDMVSFFQTLSKVDTSKKTNFLSDHPAPPDRISRIQKEAQLLRVKGTSPANVAQLNQVQARLRGTTGRSATQIAQSQTSRQRSTSSNGSVAVGSVAAPSTSLKSYTQPNGLFRVSYPSNWQVYQSSSGGVTLAPQGGIGQAGDRTEVVYGAIINHYDPFNLSAARSLRGTTGSAGGTSLEAATNDLLAQVQQSGPHLKMVSGTTQRFNLDGGPAVSVALRGVNPTTRVNERVTVVTRQLADDHLVYMLFITPENQYANYAKVLQAMVNSMQIGNH